MASGCFCYLFGSKHHHVDLVPYFGVTVTSNGPPYATVAMSCLSVNSVYNIDILWPNGSMDQRWRAELAPSQATMS